MHKDVIWFDTAPCMIGPHIGDINRVEYGNAALTQCYRDSSSGTDVDTCGFVPDYYYDVTTTTPLQTNYVDTVASTTEPLRTGWDM